MIMRVKVGDGNVDVIRRTISKEEATVRLAADRRVYSKILQQNKNAKANVAVRHNHIEPAF